MGNTNLKNTIIRFDILTMKLNEQLLECNELSNWDYIKLLNSFDRLQESIKLIKIK